MRDLAMWAAGGLGIVAAVVHGVLGETHVFAKARIEPAWTRRLLRLVWQCGALAWLGVGVLLIAAPGLGSAGGAGLDRGRRRRGLRRCRGRERVGDGREAFRLDGARGRDPAGARRRDPGAALI